MIVNLGNPYYYYYCGCICGAIVDVAISGTFSMIEIAVGAVSGVASCELRS